MKTYNKVQICNLDRIRTAYDRMTGEFIRNTACFKDQLTYCHETGRTHQKLVAILDFILLCFK